MNGSRALIVAALVVAGSAGLSGGEASIATFRFERDVVPGSPGGNRLDIDVILLAGLRGGGESRYADLRLFSAAGQELPYVLIPNPPAIRESETGNVRAIPAGETWSGFEVDLGRVTLIDRVAFEGLPAPFMKRARLDGSADRIHWVVLEAEGTLFDLPAESLRRTGIEFDPVEVRYLRITWDDASSARVGLPRSALSREAAGVPQTVPLHSVVAFERRGAEPGWSRFRLRLPAPGLPVVAVEVVPTDRNVMRRASVSETRLHGSSLQPVELGRTILRRSDRGDLVASDLRVPIARPLEAELELAIEDGDNPPLEVREVAIVLAPQPWIYFESADGAKVLARFGADGMTAPRYDLEVVRDVVAGGAAVARASWGGVRELAEAAPRQIAGDIMAGGATVDRRDYAHARAVAPGPPGLTVLPLDLDVLAGSPDLADVRLVTDQDQQVPYLVETLAEPLAVLLAPPRRLSGVEPCGIETQGAAWSCYGIGLPAAGLPAGRLAVATSVRVFSRRALLRYERQPGRSESLLDATLPGSAFRTCADTVWGNSNPERPAPLLSLSLPGSTPRQVALAIEDGDNNPLTLVSAELYLPSYRLRFFRPDDSGIHLLYGQPGLGPPRYDIALMASRLVGAAAHEAKLEPMESRPTAMPGGWGTRVFWLLLIAGSLALLFLLVRLLGGEAGADSKGA